MRRSRPAKTVDHESAPTVSFRARLAAFRARLQAILDDIPADEVFQPRLPVTIRLSLDDLTALLPPAEGRLLVHLRAREPLRALVGRPGFRNRARLDETLQRLLSRVQVYSGERVRHGLMQFHDRPGHDHHRRVGRPRSLIPPDRLPPLLLWAPLRVVVLGSHVLVLRRDLLRGDAQARKGQRRAQRPPRTGTDLPRSERTATGTAVVSWPLLFSQAVAWLTN